MLHHLDKHRGTLLSKVFLSGSGADLPVEKILTWTAADGEKPVWPEPATHLRIESNYDASKNVRKEDGAVYAHPVVNPEAEREAQQARELSQPEPGVSRAHRSPGTRTPGIPRKRL